MVLFNMFGHRQLEMKADGRTYRDVYVHVEHAHRTGSGKEHMRENAGRKWKRQAVLVTSRKITGQDTWRPDFRSCHY